MKQLMRSIKIELKMNSIRGTYTSGVMADIPSANSIIQKQFNQFSSLIKNRLDNVGTTQTNICEVLPDKVGAKSWIATTLAAQYREKGYDVYFKNETWSGDQGFIHTTDNYEMCLSWAHQS